MGKANDMKQRFKKSKRETQALVGEPKLKWQQCARLKGYPQGWKAELTKEQSEKLWKQ